MRLLPASLIAFLLSVCAASAQVTAIAWDPSPESVTGYVVSVDGAQIATTASLSVPWTPTKPTHRVCVASQRDALIGPATCLDYAATPPTTSAEGTTVPPSEQIVDAAGHIWTLAQGQLGTLRPILRDGQHAFGGYGDLLVWFNGNVYAKNSTQPAPNGSWWLFAAGTWSQIPGDPRTALPPPAPPPTTPQVPPPTPPPAPPVLSVAPTTCKVSVDKKPDTRTGWGVQFTRDGVAIGGRDTSAPYERTAPYLPGQHVWQAIWTKTGVPSVTVTVTTQGCQ